MNANVVWSKREQSRANHSHSLLTQIGNDMAEYANGNRWMIPVLTFLLGALMTAGGYTIVVKGQVDVNTTNLSSYKAAMDNYVKLSENIINVNEQLITELRIERGLRVNP